MGFAGGPMVKKPPANAEKIPHAMEQLCPCTKITEPML